MHDVDIRKMFASNAGTIKLLTADNRTFDLQNDGDVKETASVGEVKDYHCDSEDVAIMLQDGSAYLNQKPAKSSSSALRFGVNTPVRAYEGKLLFVTQTRELVALDVDTHTHITVLNEVHLFDVVPGKCILCTSSDKMHILRQGGVNTVLLSGVPRHITTTSTHAILLF